MGSAQYREAHICDGVTKDSHKIESNQEARTKHHKRVVTEIISYYLVLTTL